jgi:AhpD family alkylhydroperoxidase
VIACVVGGVAVCICISPAVRVVSTDETTTQMDEETAMSKDEHGLSQQDKELVAIGACVGAGCHPCLDNHLNGAKKAELADDRVLTAITTALEVAAQAAPEFARYVQRRFDAKDLRPRIARRLGCRTRRARCGDRRKRPNQHRMSPERRSRTGRIAAPASASA